VHARSGAREEGWSVVEEILIIIAAHVAAVIADIVIRHFANGLVPTRAFAPA